MFLWYAIISALAYAALIGLTAYLVFDMQLASGTLPRKARIIGVGLVLSLVPGMLTAHFSTLFWHISSFIWLITLVGVLCIVLPLAGVWPGLQKKSKSDDLFDEE